MIKKINDEFWSVSKFEKLPEDEAASAYIDKCIEGLYSDEVGLSRW